jgi:hypothetical protein
MKRICNLDPTLARKIISESSQKTYLRHGVWGERKPATKEQIIAAIDTAPYGADVWETDDKTTLIVELPTASDMW